MDEAKREEIERTAERVLAGVPDYIWDGRRLPVPIEHIVDSAYSLLVREVEDMNSAPGCPELAPGESLSGLLLPGLSEIWVNAAEAATSPGRRRFTIAHELGHWCMHREENGVVYCRSAVVDPTEERPPRPPREEEADVFAAALLMPAVIMREQYGLDSEFRSLCERFQVSGQAMSRRLETAL